MQTLSKSYLCGEGSTQLLYETIGECLGRVASDHHEKLALVVRHQDIRWTYAEFATQVDRLAGGLLALGIEPGDRVSIWGPNSYEWVLTQFATAKIGAIMVCINPAYRLYELEYALNKVECKALIAAEQFKSSKYLDMINQLAPELAESEPGQLHAAKLPALRTVIRMGDAQSAGMYNFDDVCSMSSDDTAQRLVALASTLQPDDAINIQFTSGTTGAPKGATLTHNNILNNGRLCGLSMSLAPDDVLCIPVPLYHCFGMVIGVLAAVTSGATMVFPGASFDPAETLAAVEAEKCTALHGVPTMFITELDHPDFDKYDLSSLRTGIMAGATCPVELMRRVIGDMHMKDVLIAYGQTECSPVNHMTLPDDTLEQRTETVGRAVPHIEIKIIDEQNRVLPVGEQGEICARGVYVMTGYWNDDEKSAETIDANGWLHSGDLGTMDELGYVKITGRIKDMVIRGGENIYPREIEEYLYTHPQIVEAQAFGIPDERMGEEVCVWIQLKAGATLTEDDIKAFCKGQIAHFKIPRYVRFVDEYPMTVTGKIRKVEMREIMTREISGS
ncbi:MAG: AMP-binding protein [Woeseiaceae bacterium]